MLSLLHRDAMWITNIVPSRQFAAGQVFGREAVQYFQPELTCVSTALTSKAGTAVMLICLDPSPDQAVSDVELGGEDLVCSLARKNTPGPPSV
jgi:hypothetical protein